MAKRRPNLSLREMEIHLGYALDPVAHRDAVGRFYSDLRAVPEGLHDATMREYDEYQTGERPRCHEASGVVTTKAVIAHGRDSVTLVETAQSGYYRFAVDVCYGFGLNVPLYFSKDEAFRVISVAKLRVNPGIDDHETFFNLPREIRDRIYSFAIPKGRWQIIDLNCFDRDTFPGGLGDPSGYYYPLSKDLAVLSVCKRMRREAMPLAYRSTTFRLDDLDDLIKLLMGVGELGRDNIESLEFPWQSKSDCEREWDKQSPSLPTLHVTTCMRLLRQCKRLRFLRVLFDEDVLSTMPLSSFRDNLGIRGLSSLEEVQKVEVYGLFTEQPQSGCLATWLKEEMEGRKKVKVETLTGNLEKDEPHDTDHGVSSAEN